MEQRRTIRQNQARRCMGSDHPCQQTTTDAVSHSNFRVDHPRPPSATSLNALTIELNYDYDTTDFTSLGGTNGFFASLPEARTAMEAAAFDPQNLPPIAPHDRLR
jgi:hypothetical protein